MNQSELINRIIANTANAFDDELGCSTINAQLIKHKARSDTQFVPVDNKILIRNAVVINDDDYTADAICRCIDEVAQRINAFLESMGAEPIEIQTLPVFEQVCKEMQLDLIY